MASYGIITLLQAFASPLGIGIAAALIYRMAVHDTKISDQLNEQSPWQRLKFNLRKRYIHEDKNFGRILIHAERKEFAP